MGRVKLKIKRLENTNGRQATYAKRKNGIMKKANELSILCDIDIILLMFSPTGKPSLCNGKRSSIEEVIAKFAQLTPQERAKRKLESLEALKKTFKKLDHDVNIQDFLGMSSHTVEDLTNQTELLQSKISEAQRRLSYWKNPEKIDNVEHLGLMEDSLRKSLNQIRAQKENLEKQQLMSISLESSSQNGMQVPFRIGVEQQFQTLPWIPNNDNQHVVLNEDPNLLQQRNIECAASSSLGAYASYLGIGNGSQMSNLKPENGILNDLSRNASLGQQFQYPSYHNISMPSNMKFQLGEEMNPTSNPLNNGQCQPVFGAQQPGFDMAQGSWGLKLGLALTHRLTGLPICCPAAAMQQMAPGLPLQGLVVLVSPCLMSVYIINNRTEIATRGLIPLSAMKVLLYS